MVARVAVARALLARQAASALVEGTRRSMSRGFAVLLFVLAIAVILLLLMYELVS
jgi:hypothetical protein